MADKIKNTHKLDPATQECIHCGVGSLHAHVTCLDECPGKMVYAKMGLPNGVFVESELGKLKKDEFKKLHKLDSPNGECYECGFSALAINRIGIHNCPGKDWYKKMYPTRSNDENIKLNMAPDTEGSDFKNYCSKEDGFSKCMAGKSWADHKLCTYGQQSSYGYRCMHYRTDGTDHCDNHLAQKAPYLSTEK